LMNSCFRILQRDLGLFLLAEFDLALFATGVKCRFIDDRVQFIYREEAAHEAVYFIWFSAEVWFCSGLLSRAGSNS